MPRLSKGYKGKKKPEKKGKECKGVDCGVAGEYKMANEQHSLEKTYKQSKKVKEKDVFDKKPKKQKNI